MIKNKKETVVIIWFIGLISLMLLMIGQRYYKVYQASDFDASSFQELELKQSELTQQKGSSDKEFDELESGKFEWMEKISELEGQLDTVMSENETLESGIQSAVFLSTELDNQIEKLENEDFDPYDINFSLSSFQNVRLLLKINELRDSGIYSIYTLIRPDIIDSMKIDNILNQTVTIFDLFLSDSYAAIKGHHNNYKADVFVDGNVMLEVSQSNDFLYLYNLTTLEDFNNTHIHDGFFSDLVKDPIYSVH